MFQNPLSNKSAISDNRNCWHLTIRDKKPHRDAFRRWVLNLQMSSSNFVFKTIVLNNIYIMCIPSHSMFMFKLKIGLQKGFFIGFISIDLWSCDAKKLENGIQINMTFIACTKNNNEKNGSNK